MIVDQWWSSYSFHSCLRSVILHLESWKNWIYLAHFNLSTPLHAREIPPMPFPNVFSTSCFPLLYFPPPPNRPPLIPPTPSTDLEFPDHPMVQLWRNNLHGKWISTGKMMMMVWFDQMIYKGYHHDISHWEPIPNDDDGSFQTMSTFLGFVQIENDLAAAFSSTLLSRRHIMTTSDKNL